MCKLFGKELKKEVERITTYMRIEEFNRIKFQPILRQYVTDKSFPLEERFEVWKNIVKKKNMGG